MLGDGLLASGLKLDAAAAVAVLEPLARELGFSVDEAAKGVITIVGSNMAGAIRELTIEQGIDPREFRLLAFGGAGPLMSTELARELGIREIIVPPHAGNFSAWGLLGADLLRSRARTRVTTLDGDAIGEINGILAGLLAVLYDGGLDDASGADRCEIALDMRFDGQEHSLTVAPDHERGRITSTPAELTERFRDAYRRSFGLTLHDKVQVVSVRAARRRALPRRSERLSLAPDGRVGELQAYSFALRERCRFETRHRGDLRVGERHRGPVIVYEPTATTYVDVDFSYGVDANGCLVLRREEH
jgi:N-methylhydantoinase A